MRKPTKWMGPYIGETILGYHTPVFFDLHTSIASSNPPGVYVSGSPGSGKSFFSMMMAYQSTLSGKITVYLDPKADSVNILNLQSDLGDINVWDLADDKKVEPGILDPFSLEKEPAQQQLLVMSLIETFAGTLTSEQRNSLTPIVEDVIKLKKPSLRIVMQRLLARRNDPQANALGNQLKLIEPLKFSRLCFDHYEGSAMKMGRGLTIITLLGLKMPDPNMDEKDYQINDRLGMGIMFLVTNYIRNIMIGADDGHDEEGKKRVPPPKTVIIDESWAVLATKMGRQVISEICRLGRSLNTACVLISQNADDIDKFGLQNSISTRFAFRVKTVAEGEKVRESFDLPEDVGIAQSMINFDKGDCIMKDFNNNVACVHIDSYDKRIFDAFNTNPFERGKK